MLCGFLAHLFDDRAGLLCSEDRRACDDHVCARLGNDADVVSSDAAVNLNVNIKTTLDYFSTDGSYLIHHIGHEFLTAKAGMNGHNEHHSELVEVGVYRLDISTGLYCKSSNFSVSMEILDISNTQ